MIGAVDIHKTFQSGNEVVEALRGVAFRVAAGSWALISGKGQEAGSRNRRRRRVAGSGFPWCGEWFILVGYVQYGDGLLATDPAAERADRRGGQPGGLAARGRRGGRDGALGAAGGCVDG